MKKFRRYLVILTAILSCIGGFASMGAENGRCYTYTTGSARINVGEEWNKAHKALGKEKACKILTDSINGHQVVAYIYDECEVRTYKNIKKQTLIGEIILKAKGMTEEGLKLGQPEKTVRELYPNASGMSGVYSVVLGDTELLIRCHREQGTVESITYRKYESKK